MKYRSPWKSSFYLKWEGVRRGFSCCARGFGKAGETSPGFGSAGKVFFSQLPIGGCENVAGLFGGLFA